MIGVIEMSPIKLRLYLGYLLSLGLGWFVKCFLEMVVVVVVVKDRDRMEWLVGGLATFTSSVRGVTRGLYLNSLSNMISVARSD